MIHTLKKIETHNKELEIKNKLPYKHAYLLVGDSFF